MSSQPRRPQSSSPPATRYEIRDASGALVAVHYRRDKADGDKQLWWELPDGTTGLGGLPLADLPLYGVDRLEAESTVVIVEGEKAADALWAAGVQAVGTVTGAASCPGRGALAELTGRQVFLWADNDDVGRRHVRRVAEGLAGIAAPVSLVEWTDAPEHGDAADFLAGGKTAEDVKALLEGAQAVPLPTPDPEEDEAAATEPDLVAARSRRVLSRRQRDASPADGWEAPTPLDLEDGPPPFPTDALPGWLRAYAEAVANATQTPPDLAAMLALATLATVAAGPILVAPAPDWREGINLFVAVAMEPGSRKSAVFKEITRPVSAHEQRLAEEMRPEIARTAVRRRLAEKRLAQLVDQAAKPNQDSTDRLSLEADAEQAAVELDRLTVPPEPRLFTSDVTSEALGSLLADHGGRFAVLSPEGGVFDQMAGLYNKGLPNPDVFLKGHAGDTIRVDRRGRPAEFVERPALTLCLAVQPNSLVAVHGNPSLSGRGLLERFFFSMPPSLVGHRVIDAPAVLAEIRAQYESAISVIARSRDALVEPVILTLTQAAAGRFRAFRAELESRRRPSGDLTYLATWASKLDGGTARLAGLLHVAQCYAGDYGRPIEAATMDAAIRIARYLIPHARVAFDLMGADVHRADAREILAWLRREEARSFTRRAVLRALQGRFPNVATLKPALDLLADHGWIRDAEGSPRPGRPRVAYEVSPYLCDSATQLTQPRKSGRNGTYVSSVSMSLEAPVSPSPSLYVGTDGGRSPGARTGAAWVRAHLEAGDLDGHAPIRLSAAETIVDVLAAARRWLAEAEGDGSIAAAARAHLDRLATALRASGAAP